MIFKQLDELLDGRKTQTWRLVHSDDIELVVPLPESRIYFKRDGMYCATPADLIDQLVITGVERKGRKLWQVGQDYAIVPKMGKPAIKTHRIRITEIRRKDARLITEDDAVAAGVSDWWEYLALWTSIYDKTAYHQYNFHRRDYTFESNWRKDHGTQWAEYLKRRPAERYQAWALTFALLENAA